MKFGIYLGMLLVLIASAMSAPPFTTSQDSGGIGEITIVHPLNIYYTQNENISLNFDILNSSLKKLDNISVNCTFYLANKNGQIEIVKNLTYEPINKVYYINYFTDDLGVHSYYIHCLSNQNEYGYLKNSFETTYNGSEDNPNDKMSIAIILLMIFVIGFLVFLASIVQLQPIRFLLIAVAGMVLILMINIGMLFAQDSFPASVQSLLSTTYVLILYILEFILALGVFYLMFYYGTKWLQGTWKTTNGKNKNN